MSYSTSCETTESGLHLLKTYFTEHITKPQLSLGNFNKYSEYMKHFNTHLSALNHLSHHDHTIVLLKAKSRFSQNNISHLKCNHLVQVRSGQQCVSTVKGRKLHQCNQYWVLGIQGLDLCPVTFSLSYSSFTKAKRL